MKVEIYKNLHKSKNGIPVYSVRCAKSKKVFTHSKEIFLENVQFKVSQKGRLRVLKEKKKNVHALVVGKISDKTTLRGFKQATYCPYHTNGFFKLRYLNKNIFYAEKAILNANGLWVKGEF